MRAFVALELPYGFADDVSALARTLERSLSGRFMRRETYHLTLAFLGDIDEVGARGAMAAMEDACRASGPIELRAEGLGVFGKARDATLWLGIEEIPELAGLAQEVRDGLSVRDIGYDKRAFRPHVTLARRAKLPEGPLPGLAFPLPAEATDVTLFKSTLSSNGASYKPLYTVGLTA